MVTSRECRRLRHLRYFAAIGEEENYRRAAQRLNVAQTALSTQIQDLEAELGFKLFDRLPRGVKLSAAGRLYLEDVRRILQQVTEAGQRAARVARGQSGTLRIGFTENASWRGVTISGRHQIGLSIVIEIEPVTIGPSGAIVVVIRIAEDVMPPYEYEKGTDLKIQLRIQDTNRRATVREIEELLRKRDILSRSPESMAGFIAPDSLFAKSIRPRISRATRITFGWWRCPVVMPRSG